MQSNAFLLSPSTPLLKSSRRRTTVNPLIRNPNPSFSLKPSVRLTSSLPDFNFVNGALSVSSSFRNRSSSLYSCSCFSSNSPHSTRRNESSVKTNAVSETAEENSESNSLIKRLELGFMIALWYIFNIYFNIFNKQVLKVYPFPVTLSAFQFAAGTVLILMMWTFNLYKKPKISTSQLLAILPLAIVHTMGNLFTNMSLGKVSVSFTHTIKAMEPFFSVLLSALFLGEIPTFWVVSSLIPVVGGVALASLTEASFNWVGLWSAMASNLTNQSRNVFSKKLMVKKEDALDNITLFSIITIMSFILMTPLALLMEGVKFTPSYLQSAGLNVRELCVRSLLLGFFFHSYQQLSYMILQRLSPVTHSVSNCVKRVAVIVSSVLFFKTPVSPINAIGTGIALAGVFLYSRVKQIKPKPKPKMV